MATYETRSLASVMARLPNATASLDGGAEIAVIFDRNYAVVDVGGGVASTAPALTLKTADVPASPRGKAAVVNGTNYTVAGHQPDGTGMSLLLLEVA